ncbi:MAG: hypothetical protein FWG44_07815 [Oscillospiraceae bacterium]|nr:hypothetical protein [Oscillospiraceae bacterium]
MKKILAILLALCMVLALTACGSENNDDENKETPPANNGNDTPKEEYENPSTPGNESEENTNEETPTEETPASEINFTGSLEETLTEIENLAKEAIGEDGFYPMGFTDPVTAEVAQNMLGFSEDDFNTYVEEAVSSIAAIATFAHQMALVKVTSGNAETVKNLIASGYDSRKWICVFPEISIAAYAGDYVLLAVGSEKNAHAVADAFLKLTGGGDSEIFFEGIGTEAETGEGGGMGLDIGGLLPFDAEIETDETDEG